MDFSEQPLIEIPYDECLDDGFGKDAKFFEIDGEDYWVPKKLIKEDDGEMITVPTWFAFEKGWI